MIMWKYEPREVETVGLQVQNQLCLAPGRQVEWLRERVAGVPIRLVFESALELMSTTQLGGFKVGWATEP